jgi:hypothetical protein
MQEMQIRGYMQKINDYLEIAKSVSNSFKEISKYFCQERKAQYKYRDP